MSGREPNFYEEALKQMEKFRLEDAMKEAGCNNLEEYKEYWLDKICLNLKLRALRLFKQVATQNIMLNKKILDDGCG